MRKSNRFVHVSAIVLAVLGVSVLLGAASVTHAQGRVDQYTTSTFNSDGFNDLSQSESASMIGDQIDYSGNDWQTGTNVTTSLPFDFNFDNTVESAGTTISIGPGYISFGSMPTTIQDDGMASSSYPGIMYFWGGAYTLDGSGEHNFAGVDATGYYGVYTETDGSDGDQVFTIQITGVHSGFGTGYAQFGSPSAQYVCNMQVKLFQSSGVIQFIYQNHDQYLNEYTQYSTYYESVIGLNGFTSPSFKSLSYGTDLTNTPSSDLQFTPPPPPAELSLQPKSLNFGTVAPSVPDTFCVTANSVGSATLHITGFSITGTGASAYSVVSGPETGTGIDPGNSVQYCIQFQPFSPGVTPATFTLNTDGADSGTQMVHLTGIGAVPLVSYGVTNLFRRTVTELGDTSAVKFIPVTSTGLGPLTFNSIYFIGLNANDYFVSQMPQNPLPPGVTDSIGIRFAPTIEGRPDASVVINTDAYNIPLDTISLLGDGTLPHLMVTVQQPGTGNTVAFDSVALGDSVCQTITLTNPGTDTLRILKQLVTYGDYDFTFYPLTGADTMIVPGASKLVTVCFKPLRYGTRLATVRFYTNIPPTFETPSRDTSQLVVNLTGIGVPYGQLSVRGSLDDTAVVGKTNCIIDTLVNKGLSDLTVSSVNIAPSNTNFAITGATTPFILAPGGMKIVSLCFSAMTRGTETDTLVLSGSTSEKSVSELLLLEGVGVVSCVSADAQIAFGQDSMTLVGAMDTSCITVTNCGDIAATYTATVPAGSDYTLVPPATSPIVPAGGTAQFCVTFTPAAIGAATGSVQILGGPTPASVVLGGVGAGIVASATGAPTAPVPIDTCNTFNITITNNGNVAWTPGTGTIGGANAADFTIVSGPTPAVIPPNGTATVTVSFCPKAQGTESMTLTFPAENPVPVAGAFSYATTGVGAASGVSLKTAQDGFVLGASYPNPTNGSAEIAVTLPYQAPVRIDLIDATGAIVQNAFTGNLGAGTQTVSIDAKGLPSGTYFYLLTSGDIRLTRQMSLIK